MKDQFDKRPIIRPTVPPGFYVRLPGIPDGFAAKAHWTRVQVADNAWVKEMNRIYAERKMQEKGIGCSMGHTAALARVEFL